MDELQRVRECALRIVSIRDHSVAELKRKLVQRSFSPDVIDSVIQSFLNSGYLDDRRFASRWVEAAVESGRCYGLRLKAELARRGIDRNTAAEIISEKSMDCDEPAALRKLLGKKFHGFDPQAANDREKRRIFGFLQRRGFSSGAIMSLFHERTD